MEIYQTLIGGLLGGGLIGFLEFLIRRKDNKDDKHSEVLKQLKEISEKISDVEARLDKENADAARRNILIFDDELRRCLSHSEESFNQVLDDINFYERYCIENPKYENSKAVNAIANINRTYQQVKHDDLFI